MTSNNEDSRQYPLTQIKQMRKKADRRRKILKAILTLICIILAFAIGFVSGFYYSDSQKFKNATPVSALSDDNADSSGEKALSDAEDTNDPPNEDYKLEGLKNEFAADLMQICSDADLSFAIKNLDTGKSIIYNDKQMNSASVIKLFIMETVFKEAADGAYNLTEKKEQLLSKMITDSDNDASNEFIDDFGGIDQTRKVTADNLINKTIVSGGYNDTQINRKMYNSTPPGGPTGYDNYTSAKDVIKFLEALYNKSLFEEPYNSKALNLLKNQQRREKIPQKIAETYPDVTVANKTGELSQVENDVALIMCDDFNLAFAVFVSNIPKDQNGNYNVDMHDKIRSYIADISLKLVTSYKQLR